MFGAADVRPECDTDFRAVLNKLVDSVDADPVGLAGVQPKVSTATISARRRPARSWRSSSSIRAVSVVG
ncbi:hypothetical protein I553_6968 [Mycobacterium xenopi 4042]|uniref:Uncharacterized protein n=1 Tax=Mycobacterium xenopi 4042 TaxID=1299334 RepID=X7Z3D9_MYCXE|nr:hypothetical protein I553_6968 [Mycobacterium xenopi 4042]